MSNISITVTGSLDEIRAAIQQVSAALGISAAELEKPSPFNTAPVSAPVVTSGFVAPTAPAQPTAVASVPAILDASGLPWDSRINTSNRAQTKKNIWKRTPGISDELYGTVINELRAAKGLPPVAVEKETPETAPAVVSAAAVAPVAPAQPTPLGGPVPGVQFPPMPAATAPLAPASLPAAAVEAVPTTFPELLSAIGKRTACNPSKITSDEITAICQKHGLINLAMANSNPQVIPGLYNDMAAIWNTRG